MKNLKIAFLMTAVTTVLLGIFYPLAVTGIAQLAFPRQANGQIIRRGDTVLGSSLIGQGFTGPEYFHSRPSATNMPYDAASSAGSNLGPTNHVLIDRVRQDAESLQKENTGQPVPIDLVTTSASGFDPHITPAAAEFQVARVGTARGLSAAQLQQLIQKHTQGRQFGVLGEPRVNVLELNLELDERFPAKR